MAIARAIYNQSDLIILDEPTTALSLTETEKVFHFVRQARAAGRSILFIGHNIHHVFDIAERFVVLDRGRVVLEATKAEIGSAEKLIKFPGYPNAINKTQSWWCGYGPSDSPDLVVCALIENGGHGGDAAAPAALKVFESFFGKQATQIGPIHSD